MVTGRRKAGVDLVAPSDLRAIYIEQSQKGKRVPVSFVIGSSPIDHVAATMRIPTDELKLLSALRGKPLGVVKCITNDLCVPADAQMILEGYLDEHGHTTEEGPYGEFLGYYGGVKKNPLSLDRHHAPQGLYFPDIDHQRCRNEQDRYRSTERLAHRGGGLPCT
jgi:UbiD family decarboxylase